MALVGSYLAWGNCLLQIWVSFEGWLGRNFFAFYHCSTARTSFSFIWPLRLCTQTFIFANHLTHRFCNTFIAGLLVVRLTEFLGLRQIVCILNCCGSFIFRQSSSMSAKFSQQNLLLFIFGLWFSWLHLFCTRVARICEVNGNRS